MLQRKLSEFNTFLDTKLTIYQLLLLRCNLSSQAKIDWNFSNNFLNTNSNNKCFKVLKCKCKGLQNVNVNVNVKCKYKGYRQGFVRSSGKMKA